VGARFETTRWSVIRAAGGSSSEQAREALEVLFEGYWFPVYGFIRTQGFGEDDARDLTQDYFAMILEKRSFGGLNPASGRFRSLQLVSLRHFVYNERHRRAAEKRGGGQRIESLDTPDAEARLLGESAVAKGADAATMFERRWATTVVRRAIDRIRRDFEQAGQADRFNILGGLLSGGEPTQPYGALAMRLDMTETAFKALVHRTRKRFGVALRGEVLQTLDSSEDIEDEIRYLLRVLAEA
jgi:DNA-directed RNA polymerase specialized sigma24 family protein